MPRRKCLRQVWSETKLAASYLKLALRYEWFPYKIKMCGAAELYFWCEFSLSVVSSNSVLDFYVVNLLLAENPRFCLLEIEAGELNSSIFHNVPPEINESRKILQKRKK